jgi:hypothetical protein
VLAKLRAFNPQIFQSILFGDRLLGLAAWLPLSEAGVTALLSGGLDPYDPDVRWLCSPGVKPAAAYCWYIHAPRRLAGALPAILAELARLAPSTPVYARPVHDNAEALLTRLGFAPVDANSALSGTLYRLAKKTPDPAGPANVPLRPVLSCRLAYTVEDLMKVFAVRAATYMNEQNCPYAEEFDGNDFVPPICSASSATSPPAASASASLPAS